VNRSNRTPRWEDIDLDDIDYETSDGLPTGHERTLRSLRSKIEYTEARLRRYLRELGVSGADPTTASIPTHVYYRDPFAFDRARRAESAQSTLKNQRRRFCELYAKHKQEKARLREEVEDDDNADEYT
jgi:hypothetical protein